jgi:hypothetical protein
MVGPGKAATRGIIFDTILATRSQPSFDSRSASLEKLRHLAYGESSPGELYCHTKESNKMVFWYTLCGSVEIILDDKVGFYDRTRKWTDVTRYENWEAWRMGEKDLEQAELYNAEVHLVDELVGANSAGRRFIKTQKGYIGWAPEKCQEGDLVVVLAGGNVPYILHAEPAVEIPECGWGPFPCYSVLGDSYVHGIMDGEVFELLDESDREMKEIILI